MYRFKCGTHEQLGYWSKNFDDFASSLVVPYVEPDGRQQLARLPLHCYHPRELHHLLGLLASQARLRVERAEERGRVGSELWADELGNALTVHNIFRKDLKEPSTVD